MPNFVYFLVSMTLAVADLETRNNPIVGINITSLEGKYYFKTIEECHDFLKKFANNRGEEFVYSGYNSFSRYSLDGMTTIATCVGMRV